MSSLLWIKNSLKNLRLGITGGIGDSVSQTQSRSPQLLAVQAASIPVKPKKPLSAYFRFMGQIREDVKKQHPSIKQTELMRLLAQRWEQLDASSKLRYVAAYKKEMETYSSILEKYNESLSVEQKEAQQQLKVDKQIRKEKREKRKRIKELGKPKKPPSAFLKFMQTKVTPGGGLEQYLSAAKLWGPKWKEISDAEKAPFLDEYQRELEEYSKLLVNWEETMIKQGNEDLVRISSTNKLDGKSKLK